MDGTRVTKSSPRKWPREYDRGHMWDEWDRVVPHVVYEDRIYLINEIPLSEGHIWAMWIERDIIRERTLRDVNRKKKTEQKSHPAYMSPFSSECTRAMSPLTTWQTCGRVYYRVYYRALNILTPDLRRELRTVECELQSLVPLWIQVVWDHCCLHGLARTSRVMLCALSFASTHVNA